jgi:hypothetical protein
MDFFWDDVDRVYRDEDGNLVHRREIRLGEGAPIDRLAEDTADRIEAISRQLIADAESEDEDTAAGALAAWQTAMADVLTASITAAGLIGGGGAANISTEEAAATAAVVEFHLAYLRNFALEIEDGLALDEAFVARARMYGGTPVQGYERSLRVGDANLFEEERRVIGSTNPCSSCEAYAALDWQPFGELPDIGSDCECLSNCQCSFERRIRKR